jgi:hypothetical protein
VRGLGLLNLDGDTMEFDLWCPDGMARHDLSVTPEFQVLTAASPGDRD